MAIMVTEVYDALRDAGASEERSRAAAMAMHEPRFEALTSEMRLQRWMISFNLALTVAVLLKQFLH